MRRIDSGKEKTWVAVNVNGALKKGHKCIDNLSYRPAVYSNQVHAAFACKYVCKQGLDK